MLATRTSSRPLLLRVVVASTLLALVAWLAAAPVSALTNVEFRNSYVVPFSETDVTCTGESVDISGTLHHRVVIVVDDRGGLHITGITRGVATGVSGSGTSYLGIFVDKNAQYFAPGEVPANGTAPFFFRLISNDGSPDLAVRGGFHITINASGQLTVFINDMAVEC